jgi:tRNA dimethylallyltransferase
MLSPPFHNSLVLTGPTASGKTQLGIDLAEYLGAEIVSMDSMALYRGMDIGTAKPTPAERARVRHHLVDVLETWESSTVAWWLKQAADCCRDIEARGKRVLFVGGTPLYLKALCCGLFDGPPADVALRQRLEDEAATRGSAVLHERLGTVDPASAGRIHPNDVRRMVRALEVHELTGRPLSAWQTQWQGTGVRDQGSGIRDQGSGVRSQGTGVRSQEAPAKHQASGPPTPDPCPRTPVPCSLTPVLWLDLPRAELYARIDRRVEAMFDGGFIEEVERLRKSERPWSREAAKALGYREVTDYLDGRVGRAEAIARVQTRSRQFAKRQLTWFRNLPACEGTTKELTWARWCRTMKA